MNIRIGRIGRLFAPGYGQCRRCKTPWNFVDPHVTNYINDPDTWKRKGGGSGCTPLCQKCWAELTPRQRLPFYRQLIEYWYARWPTVSGIPFDEEWTLMKAAVLAGR